MFQAAEALLEYLQYKIEEGHIILMMEKKAEGKHEYDIHFRAVYVQEHGFFCEDWISATTCVYPSLRHHVAVNSWWILTEDYFC